MAVTATLMLDVQVGAVRSPEVEIDPALVDHVTAVFVEPLTEALNCLVLPEATAALVGDIETDTCGAVSWKTWLAEPLQVFCSTELVRACRQPLAMLGERIVPEEVGSKYSGRTGTQVYC